MLKIIDKDYDKVKLDKYIKKIIRAEYSSPSYYGSMIVENILKDKNKKDNWLKEVNEQVQKLKNTRLRLFNMLKSNNIYWEDLLNTNGLFYQTNLGKKEITLLKEKYGIYMLENGRINIAALNDGNIIYFVNCIKIILK